MSQTRAITTGSGIVIAVVDTGISPHPDLRKNLLGGSDQTSGGHGSGTTDEDGHGTRMAALIAGHGKTSTSGIQGIAPSAKVLSVKVSTTGRNIKSSLIGKGIDWAVSQHAKVINVSLSAGPAFELQDAVNAAIDANVVVVAGVGNTTTGAIIGYPAAMDGVLAVGATGRNGKYATISIKDAKVQICAPGVDIESAQPKDRYGLATGTSDSTAIVSGAAALVRAKFPQLSAKDVINRLTATADDIGPPGRDNECGFGRLNIVKALTADVPPVDGEASSTPSATVTTPATAATTPAFPGNDSAGESEPTSNSLTLVLGVLVGVIVAGGLAALALRKRRSS